MPVAFLYFCLSPRLELTSYTIADLFNFFGASHWAWNMVDLWWKFAERKNKSTKEQISRQRTKEATFKGPSQQGKARGSADTGLEFMGRTGQSKAVWDRFLSSGLRHSETETVRLEVQDGESVWGGEQMKSLWVMIKPMKQRWVQAPGQTLSFLAVWPFLGCCLTPLNLSFLIYKWA